MKNMLNVEKLPPGNFQYASPGLKAVLNLMYRCMFENNAKSTGNFAWLSLFIAAILCVAFAACGHAKRRFFCV